MDIPDDTEINTVWDEEKQELLPTGCDGFYHKEDNAFYLTPNVIALQEGKMDIIYAVVGDMDTCFIQYKKGRFVCIHQKQQKQR